MNKIYLSIVGSLVECSPATRAARVRFPDDAKSFILSNVLPLTKLYHTYSLSLSQKKPEEEIELNFLKSQKSTIFRQLEWEKLKKSAEAPGATLDHASLSFWKALRQAPKASEKSREITDKWKKVKNKQTSGTLRKRVPMGEKCKRASPCFYTQTHCTMCKSNRKIR